VVLYCGNGDRARARMVKIWDKGLGLGAAEARGGREPGVWIWLGGLFQGCSASYTHIYIHIRTIVLSIDD
jgi:hypothetical protein